MTEAERFEKLINAELPRLKRGSLRFWGEWFGRPHDNIHFIIGCEAERDNLWLKFNEDEVLYVRAPQGGVASDRIFKIAEAEHVRWEWYKYGEPKTKPNLYFMDFIKKGNAVETHSNVNWYSPDLKPTLDQSAVEIL